MTGRERLRALMQHRVADRLSWTALVDGNTLGSLPAEMQGISALDFYRHIGCDILQLGGWAVRNYQEVQLEQPGVDERWYTDDDGNHVWETACPRGMLQQRYSAGWHPLDYPVKTHADLRVLLARYEESTYRPAATEDDFHAVEAAVGDDGLTVVFTGPTAVPYLLENLMGIEQFYYFLDDYPDEMAALIHTMDACNHRRFELLAQFPADALIIAENTSTRYIGPKIYEYYNMPAQTDFVDTLHQAGKTAILHMCGHVGDLLPLIKETGTDGIHTLTPPPLGDCPWEAALDVIGDDLIIFGCLTPDLFQQADREELFAGLDRLITPRIAASPFCLSLFADGITVPLERFQLVGEWVAQHGV